MIAIDANMLLLFLSRVASAPLDPSTGKPIPDAKERVDFLIETAQKARTKVVIPTPVLSEALVRAGPARTEYLRLIQQSAFFKIMPFDVRAAVDVADMTKQAIDAGDKRGGSLGTWAKVKFDRQLVAIAKNERVTAIYSDDPDVKNIAALFGIPVFGLIDLPVPPSALQGSLPLQKRASPSAPGMGEENALPSATEVDAALAGFDDDPEGITSGNQDEGTNDPV